MNNRGYYGLVLYEPKFEENWGTVMRSAFNFEANFVVTVGNRYKTSNADTTKTERHIPVFHFPDWVAFLDSTDPAIPIVGIEVTGKTSLKNFVHPERCIYVLGGEDRSIPPLPITLRIDTRACLNLAVAASIIMYDRQLKKA